MMQKLTEGTKPKICELASYVDSCHIKLQCNDYGMHNIMTNWECQSS